MDGEGVATNHKPPPGSSGRPAFTKESSGRSNSSLKNSSDAPVPAQLTSTPSREALNVVLNKTQLDELKRSAIVSSDKFYKHKQFQQSLDCLIVAYEKLPQESEILWRLCRAYFELSELQPKEARQQYLEVGFQFAEKGLSMDDKNPLFHKWWAIFCSLLGDYQNTKEKIGNAFKIKEHAMRANELAPGDATTLHLLGRWCFSVAGISWLERTAATALFGTPPASTYEEALGYFMKAHQLDEKFTRNIIYIGDCYVNLKKYSDAKNWYRKAADVPFDEKLRSEVAYHEEAENKCTKYKSY